MILIYEFQGYRGVYDPCKTVATMLISGEIQWNLVILYQHSIVGKEHPSVPFSCVTTTEDSKDRSTTWNHKCNGNMN